MDESFEEMKLQIKENITALINNNKLQEAQRLLKEYTDIVSNDPEVSFMESNIAAKKVEEIRRQQPFLQKQKVAIICAKGLDSFIHDISRELGKQFVVKVCIVENEQEVHQAVDWADIIWLEWGNESTILATKYKGIIGKKVIVRIHGYEVFTDMPMEIKWSMVDKLIFVAEHKREIFFERFGPVIDKQKTCVVRNGIDVTKFNFEKNKNKNKNIACIGNINYRKGLDLLIQFFYDLLQEDPEYILYVRGSHQDLRYKIAIDTMLKELHLQDKVIFVGRVDNINEWLKDMSYIVSSSLEESFHYSIGEGMLAGLKPIIHAWRESRDIWPNEFIYRNSDEFRKVILDEKYEPEKYRNFVVANYSLTKQMNELCELFYAVTDIKKTNRTPLVTIGITNYNAEKYVDECIKSILNQTYKKLEIIIIDDQSIDGSVTRLKKYAKKHKQIKIIQHNPNSGSPDLGRREIIEQANGEYFMLFDSDDFFADHKAIEKLVQVVVQDDSIDYAYCDLGIVNERSHSINKWTFAQYDVRQVVQETFRRGGSGILTMKGLFKTEFFRSNGISYLSNGTAGDTLTSLLCMQKGMNIRYLGEPLIAYRQHQNNFTFDVEKRINSVVTILEYIVNNFSEQIYFPEREWDKISNENRQANKYYLVTELYYHVFKQYHSGQWKPWENEEQQLDEAEVKRCLIPLHDLLLSYSQRISDITECYNNDLTMLREDLKKIYNTGTGSLLINSTTDRKKENISLKFLLRRVENVIDLEESLRKIFDLLVSQTITIPALVELVKQCVIYPDQVLNDVGTCLFSRNYVDDALNLLNSAYSINVNNQDVLFNIGIIAYEMGDLKTATLYLQKLEEPSELAIRILQESEV